jgi:UDP-glucose 4-epimerase
MSETAELANLIAGQSVLVTGGSGFIGTRLCRRLMTCGARLHVLSRKPRQSEGKDLQWWQVDLRQVGEVRDVVRSVKPDTVFHLASHVAGARDLEIVLPTFYDNLASTVHLLTAVREMGCRRVVLAGSSEEPQTSEGTPVACSPYAAAKWASGVYGRMFYQLFDLPVVIPRIFMTYGPDQKDIRKLVPFVVLQLLRGETPELTSGRRRADWIYIDDVVEGLLRAALVPRIEGCSFDLGTGSLVSVRNIVQEICDIIGTPVEPVFGALPDRPFEQERPADTSFLIDKLGYRPKTTLNAGLQKTVAYYRRHVRATLGHRKRAVSKG